MEAAPEVEEELTQELFLEELPIGDRVLTCGDGDELGCQTEAERDANPKANPKPRKVNKINDRGLKFRQVAAGGTFMMALTTDSKVRESLQGYHFYHLNVFLQGLRLGQ